MFEVKQANAFEVAKGRWTTAENRSFDSDLLRLRAACCSVATEMEKINLVFNSGAAIAVGRSRLRPSLSPDVSASIGHFPERVHEE